MAFTFRNSQAKLRSIHALVLALSAMIPAGAFAQPQANAPIQSYGIWTARWWQWALNQTVATSPLLGPDAENPARPYCAYSGLDAVWFVSGTLGTAGPVIRECTVPAGSRLFFPVANYFFVRDQFLIEENGRWPLKWSKDVATAEIDGVLELSATFDGMQIPNLRTYRVASPAFALTLPPGHIFEAFGYPAGLYMPAISDGYWLMLPPLTQGKHTLRLYARFANGGVLDVTYTIFAQL